MNIIAGLLLDGYYTVKHQLLKLTHPRVPQQWQTGSRGDVVLVPGWNEGWQTLSTLGQSLNAAGFRIHIYEHYRSLGPSYELAEGLAAICRQYPSVSIIAHSKGGIVTAVMLQKYPEIKAHIKSIITVATPYGGSMISYLAVFGLWELRPGSPLLRGITANNITMEIHNLFSRFETLVVPNRNLVLAGADNKQLATVGHNVILESKPALELILNILNA